MHVFMRIHGVGFAFMHIVGMTVHTICHDTVAVHC